MANKKNQKKSLLSSMFIALLIVAMLIFSGPAQAVSVMILGLQDEYTQGSSVKFQVQIDINDPDQFIPITDVTVNLTGQATRSGVFTLDGKLKSGDNIISVKPNSTNSIPKPNDFGYGYGSGYGYGYGYNFGKGTFGYADFGYGYPSFGNGYGYGYMAGYGYGSGYGGRLTYIYDVTIDTSNLPVGDYDVGANLNTGIAANPKFISGSKHFTLTQPATPPRTDGGGSSSSGGSGGGGVSTPEPFENIIKYETRDCFLTSGKPSSCKFTVPEHWVSELVVTGKESESATFRIEALKGLSPHVKVPAPGTKYLNIWPGSRRIQEALIRFRVENTWIASEGLTAENLRMYNWDGSKWNELDTKILSKDASATNYEAKTSAFSYFAISGIKEAKTTVPATPSAISPTTPTVTQKKIVPGMEGTPAPSMNLYLIFGVFIVILAGVVFYFARKK